MSGALPTWLQNWLGIESIGSGDGTLWALDHVWPWASWFTLLFVLLAIGYVAFTYATEPGSTGRRMRTLLAVLRLTAIALVLAMIAEGALTLDRTGLPYVVVMIDDSGSMATADPLAPDAPQRATLEERLNRVGLREATRLNLAKTLLVENDGRLLQHLAEHYKLQVYFVSDTARPQSGNAAELVEKIKALEPAGQSSRLGQGLRSVLGQMRGRPPAAVIVLSDGITTDGETLAEVAVLARRKSVPLFTIGLGSETPLRDLEVSDLLVDDVVFVNDLVSFDFKLTATGLAGRQVEVVLKEKGTDQPLASQPLTLGPDDQPQRVRLPYRPTKTGEFEYTVQVANLPEELRSVNNRETRLVSVREEKFRVLLVQAYPSFEFRYLKEMLKRNDTIQLRYVLQEADVDFSEVDQHGEPISLATFPLRREELFEYDVVIFGDVNPALISGADLQNLADFVTEKAGGLVFIAGPQFTPARYAGTSLAPLVPFEASQAVVPGPNESIDEGFVVRPTELGLASPMLQLGDTTTETAQMWRTLPPLYFLIEAPPLKPAARVLAEHPTRIGSDGKPLPVFIMQYVGAGRVLFQCTDDTWRWRYQVGDVFFARYWLQTIRALSRAKLIGKDRGVRLTTDRDRFERGQSVRLQVRFLDERQAPAADNGAMVLVERTGHPRQQVALHRSGSNRGVFEATLVKPAEGKYHAWLVEPAMTGEPATDFQVLASKGESQRLQMDVDQLRRAADDTKGKFYTFASADRLLQDLTPGRQIPIERLPPVSLWNRWPVLALLLVLLVTEWLLRKRCSMA